MLSGNHDGSRPRWQPGAVHTQATGLQLMQIVCTSSQACVKQLPGLSSQQSDRESKSMFALASAAVVELHQFRPGAAAMASSA